MRAVFGVFVLFVLIAVASAALPARYVPIPGGLAWSSCVHQVSSGSVIKPHPTLPQHLVATALSGDEHVYAPCPADKPIIRSPRNSADHRAQAVVGATPPNGHVFCSIIFFDSLFALFIAGISQFSLYKSLKHTQDQYFIALTPHQENYWDFFQ